MRAVSYWKNTILNMNSAIFFFLTCSLAISSADETSFFGEFFAWEGGWDEIFWAVGAADSYLESKTCFNVPTAQRFVDRNIQHYKNQLVKEGRNLSEHFLDSAYLDCLKPRPAGSPQTSLLELTNVSLSGLSKPLIRTITKNQYRSDGKLKFASYNFDVTYRTLVLNASFHYRYHEQEWNPRDDVQCFGFTSVKMDDINVTGTIKVDEDSNGNLQNVTAVILTPHRPSGWQIELPKCSSASNDAMVVIFDDEKHLTGRRLTNKFLPIVETKMLHNLNSLINSPGFPVN